MFIVSTMTYIHIVIIAKEMCIYTFKYNNIQNQEFYSFTIQTVYFGINNLCELIVCNITFIEGSRVPVCEHHAILIQRCE